MSTKRPLPEPSSSSESEYTDEEEDSDTEEKAAMVQTARNSKEDNRDEKKKQENEDEQEEEEDEEDEDDEDDDEDEDDVPEASVPKPNFPNAKVQDEACGSDDYDSGSGSGSQSDESLESPDMSTLQKRASTKTQQNIKLAKQDHKEERPAKKVKMVQAGDLLHKAGVRGQLGNVARRSKLPEKEAISDTMNKKVAKDKPNSVENGGMSDERVKAQMRDKPEEASHKGTPNVKRTEGASDLTKKSKEQKHEEKSLKNSESEMPVSPQKSKHWTPQEEIALSTALLNDMKAGNEIPNKKSDGYWNKLSQNLQGMLENEWHPEQLCEKVKRMKTRYSGMADKMKGLATPYTFRNKTDPLLFGLWTQLWGTAGDHNQDVVAGSEDTVKKLSGGLDNSKGVNKLKTKRLGTQGVETEKPAVEEGHEAANAFIEVNSVPSFPHKGTGDEAEHSKEEVYAVLAGLQECTQKVLYEWQKKATLIIDNALKTVAHQATAMGGVCPPGIGGLTNLAQFTSLVAELSCPMDKALQKEWSQLRYQELNLYLKKLQLMQKECELKMQQLRSQPDRDESCG